MNLKDKWYGVKLTSGLIKVKRYTGEEDLDHERASFHVLEATDVIVASTKGEAYKRVCEMLSGRAKIKVKA